MEGGIDKASGTTIPASAGVVLRAVAQVLFFLRATRDVPLPPLSRPSRNLSIRGRLIFF